MKSYIVLIVGMMLVTYLPRLLPMLALSESRLSPVFRRFLLYIPYTALGALIVRGAFQSMPDMPAAALAGIGAAAVCSWFKGGLVLSVIASILAAFLVINGIS